MSQPGPPPQSDLSTRFAAGVVLIAVACALIYAGGTMGEIGGWAFRLSVAAGAGILILEWGDMHKAPRPWTYAGITLLVAALLLLAERYYPAGEIDVIDGIEAVTAESFNQVWVAAGALVVAGIVYGVFARRLALGWGFVYVALPAFALIVLEWARWDLVFWLMLVTWATDIFAYFAGRRIGGPKLAPRISPNKTWAGLIGGMAGAAVIAWIAAWAFGIGAPFLWLGAPMGLLVQLGDLYESRVKRRLGVKDSGAIIPGHGGLLDRADGLLPVTVATLLVLVWSLSAA